MQTVKSRGRSARWNGASQVAVAMLVSAAVAGCDLKTPDERTTLPTVLSVEVAPADAVLETGGSVQLSASVRGTGPVPQVVTWSLADSNLPDFSLLISPTGLVKRTDAPPLAPTRLVAKATSVVDGAISGSVVILVPPYALTVGPAGATVVAGESVQLTASVTGYADKRVAWSVGSGAISDAGLFTAPVGLGPVRVQVQAHSAATGEAVNLFVQVTLQTPVLTGISGPAKVGDTVTLTGTNLSQSVPVRAVFTDAVGQPVAASCQVTGTGSASATVPPGAVSGPVHVELDGGATLSVRSNDVTFEAIPRLRLRTPRTTLAGGESILLQTAVSGAAATSPVVFTADVGSLVGARYTAPSGAPLPAHANIKACVAGTTGCAGVTLALVPFRVEPSPALVPPGGTLALTAATVDGPQVATWSLLSGGGSVSPDGHYTAPLTPDGGPIRLQASSGGVDRQIQVVVTDLVPGTLARLAGEQDPLAAAFQAGVPWLDTVDALTAATGKLYVATSSQALQGGFAVDVVHWIDVYDLSDPRAPAWLGAAEATAAPHTLRVVGGRVYALARPADTLELVEAFDVGVAQPALVERLQIPRPSSSVRPIMRWNVLALDGATLYRFGVPDEVAATLPLEIRALGGGALGPPRQVTLPLPPDAIGGIAPVSGVAAADGLVYATYQEPSGRKLARWDPAPAQPTSLAAVQGVGGLGDVQVAGALAVAWFGCWDRRTEPMTPVTCPNPLPTAIEGALGAGQSGADLVTFDLTDPVVPTPRGRVTNGSADGVLQGGFLYARDASGALVVQDLRPPGGPSDVGSLLP